MTRSMVFTNTSNWDGEDYVLTLADGGVVGYDEHGQPFASRVLAPGDSVSVTPQDGDRYIFEPVTQKRILPFTMNGRQMIPRADGAFELVPPEPAD